MKKPFLVIGMMSLSFWMQAKEVMSKVDQATVFVSGAQVQRSAKVNLQKGENTLTFLNLEYSINPQTIQIYGASDMIVVSKEFKTQTIDENFLPKEQKEIKTKIEGLDKKITFINSAIANYRSEKNLILHNKEVRSEQDGLIVDDLMALAQFYRKQLNVLDSLIYEDQERVNDLVKEKNKLNKELTEIGFRNSMGVMVISIISKEAKPASLVLDYVVNGVGWTPFYEVKSDGANEDVNVALKASIYQNTGANWDNVKLSLSTGSPMNYGKIPEVHPWVLYFSSNYREKGYQTRTTYDSKRSMSNVFLNSAYIQEDEVQTLANFTTTTDNITTMDYDVSLPYNIKGNNGKAIVDLDEFVMKAKYVYYTAPKFDKNVYLLADIEDWEQFDLLPGEANIFLEGKFVGNTFIDPSQTSDTLSILMGKDERVIAKRTKIKDYCKKSFFGGKNSTELGMQVMIKNNKAQDIKIIVDDQVPISKIEDIEVKLLDKSGAKLDDETGKLTWEYTLKSKDVKSHVIRYEVKYPKNKTIENL